MNAGIRGASPDRSSRGHARDNPCAGANDARIHEGTSVIRPLANARRETALR